MNANKLWLPLLAVLGFILVGVGLLLVVYELSLNEEFPNASSHLAGSSSEIR